MPIPRKPEPWESKWTRVGLLSDGGGQGRISLVGRLGADAGRERFALKVLKDQRSKVRRLRMHREVAALQTLQHPGIPKCLDSNAHCFADPDVSLYIVTEYILGPTLEAHCADTPISPEVAISCTLRILDILSYCHENEVIHRDVKPENIIVRNNQPLDPVLLDFGLSFNAEEKTESVTWTGQELGNRFLHLPELQHPGSTQRDARSDLTQCCGVLFYLITGTIPRTLYDHEGRKPHRRQTALQVMNSLGGALRTKLYETFEKGFEQQIDRRFQTAEEMRNCVSNVEEETREDAVSQKIKRIRAAVGLDATNQRHLKYVRLLEEAGRIVADASKKAAEKLFGEDASVTAEQNLDAANLRLTVRQSVMHRSQPDKAFRPEFLCTVNESQLCVYAHERSGMTTAIFFSALDGPNDWPQFQATLLKFYVNKVDEVYGGRIRTQLTQPLPQPRSTSFSRQELISQLSQLPLRAIVAFAARCARRAQPVFARDRTHPDYELHATLVEKAISAAENFAKGDPTAAGGECAHEVMGVATAAISTPAGNDARPDFSRTDSALSASDAITSAISARQNNASLTAACAADAYSHALGAAPPSLVFAALDLRQLLISDLGQHPDLGSAVDPGEGGLLGPLWAR